MPTPAPHALVRTVLRHALRCALLLLLLALPVLVAAPASATPGPVSTSADTMVLAQVGPAPAIPQPGGDLLDDDPEDRPGRVTFDVDGGKGAPSKTIVVVLMMTVLSLAPALLILMTSFTRILIVLSLTRNALGVQAIPPNQVLVGLSLFLSLFIMGPTLSEVNEKGLQPFLNDEKSYTQAYEDGVKPLRTFMLKEVKEKELALFVKAAGDDRPEEKDDVSMSALVPAFVLSEIKTAFLIGFIIFIPFLVIDIVVSSSLMSMGMMMLPPVLISLPFKLLLFVMVDGWALIIRSLLASYA
jgi:flagellar biosynthetic protein FliP